MRQRPVQPAEPFRPAPFAIYADSGSHSRQRGLQRTLLLLAILFCALPGPVGPQSTLILPVYYGLIELEDRTPVLLNLGLPEGQFNISPNSLGYFTEDNKFVYTADVARGLIYGMLGERPVVYELRGPAKAPLYFEDHLQTIRTKVSQLNARQNLLKIARDAQREGLGRFTVHEKDIAVQLSPEQAGLPDAVFSATLAEDNAGRLTTLTSAIVDEARNSADLKRLYYDTQLARLDLLLSEFDLQIAMARVPRPEIEQLVSLGDDEQVKGMMLAEISRLRSAWQQRRDLLAGASESSNRLMLQLNPPAPPVAEGMDTPAPEHLTFHSDTAPLPPLASMEMFLQLEPAVELELSILQGRQVVAEAELAMLAASLERLDIAELHVTTGGVPNWANLPSITVDIDGLELARTDILPDLRLVEQATERPSSASQLLLGLAVSFAGGKQAGPTSEDSKQFAGMTPYPTEVAYGLISVEYSLRPDNPGTAGLPAGSPRLMLNRLHALMENPHEYGAAAHDLGYLRFIEWYAQLVSQEYGVVADYQGGWSTHT